MTASAITQPMIQFGRWLPKRGRASVLEMSKAHWDMSERTLVSQGATAFQVVLAIRLLPGVCELSRIPGVHHLHSHVQVNTFQHFNLSKGYMGATAMLQSAAGLLIRK